MPMMVSYGAKIRFRPGSASDPNANNGTAIMQSPTNGCGEFAFVDRKIRLNRSNLAVAWRGAAAADGFDFESTR